MHSLHSGATAHTRTLSEIGLYMESKCRFLLKRGCGRLPTNFTQGEGTRHCLRFSGKNSHSGGDVTGDFFRDEKAKATEVGCAGKNRRFDFHS
jgi:hypothetical protein